MFRCRRPIRTVPRGDEMTGSRPWGGPRWDHGHAVKGFISDVRVPRNLWFSDPPTADLGCDGATRELRNPHGERHVWSAYR